MARVRSSSSGSLWLAGIVIAIVGLFFAVPAIIRSAKIKSGNLLNLNDAALDDIKSGKYCEITLNYDYGCYAEYVETSKYGGSKRTTQKYYLVDTDYDEGYYLGIRVSASNASDLESLSYADIDSTRTVTFKGVLKKQSGDAQKFYEEYIEDMWKYYGDYLTDEQWDYIESISLPYYLDVETESSTSSAIVIGLIMAGIGIIMIIVDIAKKKKISSISSSNPMGYGNYDANSFGNYSGNDMSNPYGGDSMNQAQPPYSPGDAATPYQDPFQQQQSTDTTGSSSDSFSLKN